MSALAIIAQLMLWNTVVFASNIGDSPIPAPLPISDYFSEKKAACTQLTRGITKPKADPLNVVGFFIKITDAINKKDIATLLPMFHPKMKITETEARRIVEEAHFMYGSPMQASLYRVWALNTVDGSPKALPCFDDALALGPHYGYDLQFAAWIQLQGSKELARMYVSAVPKDGKLLVGAWHSQQWTFESKDPAKIVEEAQQAENDKKNLKAFVLLDLASKLLDGAGYVFLPDKDQTVAMRDKLYTKQQILDVFRETQVVKTLLNVGTIFSSDGPGFLFRMGVPADVKTSDLAGMCHQSLQEFYSRLDPVEFGAARCSFLRPGENPAHEGSLGSLLVKKQKILEILKK